MNNEDALTRSLIDNLLLLVKFIPMGRSLGITASIQVFKKYDP